MLSGNIGRIKNPPLGGGLKSNKFIKEQEYYSMSDKEKQVTLYNADCLELMAGIPDGSVQLILTDPPYAETGNKWDKFIDFPRFLAECERVLKPEGALVMTSTTRLASKVIPMAEHLYKYDLVWVKDNGTNAPNVNLQPFRVHELILVFGKGRVTNGKRTPMKYNPQKTSGKAYTQKSGKVSENWKGGLKNVVTVNDGDRHPLTVQKWTRDRGLHPTQKPVAMFEWLMATYTDEGDTVLDPFMGSGTTGVACVNLDRKFIGIELDENYFKIAEDRIKESVSGT